MKFKLLIVLFIFPLLISAQISKKELLNNIKESTLAIEKDHQDFSAYLIRSMSYYELKDYDKAIPDLKRMIGLDPDYLYSYLTIADIYSIQHKFKEAGKYYDLAIKNGYEMNNRLALVMGSNFYFTKEYDLAIKFLLMAIDENEDIESGAYNNLAWAYLYTDQLDLSVEYFQKAYEVNPNFVNNVNNLGYAYYVQGKLDTAEEYILKAKKMDPKNAFVYRNLGLIYKKRNNANKACKNYNKALSLNIVSEWGIDYVQELKDYCDAQ